MDKVISKFRTTLRQFEREVNLQNENCCNTGISLTQCHLILDIEDRKQTSITQLAQIQNLDKSTVSRTIDNLYNKGLINREIDPTSRRQSIVSLNSEGAKICKMINKINDEFFHRVFTEISPEEMEQFSNIFEKVTAKMTELHQLNSNCCKNK